MMNGPQVVFDILYGQELVGKIVVNPHSRSRWEVRFAAGDVVRGEWPRFLLRNTETGVEKSRTLVKMLNWQVLEPNGESRPRNGTRESQLYWSGMPSQSRSFS